jgi:hypothetical protein
MAVAFYRIFPGDITACENIMSGSCQPPLSMQVEYIANTGVGDFEVTVINLLF